MKGILVIALMMIAVVANAQNWEEWSEQKKTQRKYLLQQIAALSIHLDYITQGYDIAGKGLQAIGKSKTGDWRIHERYFQSLVQVSPVVREYTKVSGTINYQLNIVRKAKRTMANMKNMEALSPEEKDYCSKMLRELITQALENLDLLTSLVSSGVFELKEEERLMRIDDLYLDVQDQYAFACAFIEEIALLATQRLKEAQELQQSKTLNALK